jgi:site-specific DNA recombinase
MRKEGLVSKAKNIPVNRTAIEHILKNPFYYGEMRVKEQLYKHNYEPIITKWLFDKCEEIRQSWHKKPFKHGSKPFAYRGLVKCAYCGCTITSDLKKGKYVYMSCTGHRGDCGALRVREEVITEQIEGILQTFVMPKNALIEYNEFLKSSSESEYQFHRAIIKEIVEKMDKIKLWKKESYKDKLERRITSDEYDNLCKEWDQELLELETQLAQHNKADKEFFSAISTLADIAARAAELFAGSKPEQKCKLVNFIFSNLRLEGKKLLYELKMPFDKMALLSESGNWLPVLDTFRTQNYYTAIMELFEELKNFRVDFSLSS